jgi:hypothetical protein
VYASIFTDFPAKFHCQEDEEESFQLDTWSKEGTAAIAHIDVVFAIDGICLSRKNLN